MKNKNPHTQRFLMLLSAVILCAFFGYTGYTAYSVSAATISKSVSNNGLVGWWTLDEGTSTIAHDFSGQGNHGVLSNAPTWIGGKRGRALQFVSGSSQSVNTIPTNSFPTGINPVSMFAWVKTTSGSRESALSYGNSVTGQAATLNVNQLASNGHFMIDFYNTYADSGVVVNDGLWHHVGFSTAGNTTSVTMYVDGVAYAGTLSGSAPNIAASTNAQIGRWITAGAGDTSGYYFSGSIDDPRVYNRALSATEVSALYRSNETIKKNVSNNGLVGWWRMDEGTSTTAHDFSGLGNNGTFNNIAAPATASSGWSGGKKAKAVSFDSVDDYISVPNSTSLQPLSGNWSVSFWIYRLGVGTGDYPQIIGSRPWGTGTDKGWAVSYSTGSGKIGAHYADGAAGFDVTGTQSATSVALNTWQHWTVVFDRTNGQLRYYLNGQLDGQGVPAFPTSSINQTNLVYMGREIEGANSRRLNARLDDIRVYNRALTTAEIQALAVQNQSTINASQNLKMTDGLVGLWSFDGKDMDWRSNKALDGTGANNGILVNMSTSTSPVSGKIGQGLLFNGSNTRVTTTYNGQLTDFTVSLWFKDDGTAQTYERLADKNYVTGFWLGRNNTTANSWGGGVLESAGPYGIFGTFPDGKWNHLVSVRSGTTHILYANGVQVASNTVAATALDTTVFEIGNGTTNQAGGVSIDEVRLYNRAVSAAEAKQLYLMGK